MLEKLLGFIEGPHADEPFVRLDSLCFEELDAVLDVSVMDYDCTETRARWRIRARDVRECRIGRSGGDVRLLEADHVLIRQHTDPQQTLHFRGIPQSADATLGQLWASHRHEVLDWIPFERFLNSKAPLPDLLAGGYGLLADGPTFLIEAYARVLSSAGLSPNASEPRPAKWWNGREWLANPPALAAIELGESLVVAERFDEEHLSPNAS
jgi:hypothetical protein